MNEEEIKPVEPIQVYDNYVTTDNKVFGVVDGGFEEIPFISGLYKIGNIVYFSIDDKNYKQESGVIEEIDISPEVPVSKFFVFDNTPFKIQEAVWNDTPVSRVYKGTSVEGYMQIDGACMRGNDLLYSVSIGTAGREVGVYIWTANSKGTNDLFENGRIW